jgi:hypothetical protein
MVIENKIISMDEFIEDNPNLTTPEFCETIIQIIMENAENLILDQETGDICPHALYKLQEFIEHEF